MNKKRFLCKLLGHQENPDVNDGGYPICLRCGAHGYYDEDTWNVSWMYWPVRSAYFVHDVYENILKFHRCAYCGKRYLRSFADEFCSSKCYDDWMPF